MKQLLEPIVIRLPFYFALKNVLTRRRQKHELIEWQANGRPVPPPHLIKQELIRNYAQRYRLRVLVETGTFKGDMVQAMKPFFDRIYSIELSDYLYCKARQRFKRQQKVTLIHGDSATELKGVIEGLKGPALFWLDGHYSAGVTAKGQSDTPVMKELGHIFDSSQRGHVILIDDAHLFGTDPAYPSLDEIRTSVTSKEAEASIDIQSNIIVIVLKQ